MPVCGDKVIFSNNSAEESKPEVSDHVSWHNRMKLFTDIKFAKGCIIVPEFVPDTEIPITLSKEALERLVNHLGTLFGDLSAGSKSSTLEMVYTIKLLYL